jgi:hypothetical protein
MNYDGKLQKTISLFQGQDNAENTGEASKIMERLGI